MCEANTPNISVCATLVKLYRILIRFQFQRYQRTKFFFPQLASGLTRIFLGFRINLSREQQQRRMPPGLCRGQILLIESATIEKQKNVSLDSAVVLPFFIHATIATNTSWHFLRRYFFFFFNYLEEEKKNVCTLQVRTK